MQIEDAVKVVRMARHRFLYGMQCVPDDRLEWSPGGEARSALGVAGYYQGFLQFIAHCLRERAFPEVRGPGAIPTTRAEAVAALDAAFAAVEDALLDLDAADLEAMVPTPWHTLVTRREWICHILSVLGYFQGQLNYLQRCYGDVNPNIPEGWGQE
jgi:hypothetical protein